MPSAITNQFEIVESGLIDIHCHQRKRMTSVEMLSLDTKDFRNCSA